MPYLMPGRNESAVYLRVAARLEKAEDYIRERNLAAKEGASPRRLSLFSVVLAAAARTLHEKPELNRFVRRRVLYQRDGVSMTFFVRKGPHDVERAVKLSVGRDQRLSAISDEVHGAMEAAKGSTLSPDEDEMRIFHSIPGGKAIATGLFRALDALNIAPRGMLKADPLYTSAFVANLGSIGLDAPYHHLYEWGTGGIFIAIGRAFRDERGDKRLDMAITLDERVSSAISYARAVSAFRHYVENPRLLEESGASDAADSDLDRS